MDISWDTFFYANTIPTTEEVRTEIELGVFQRKDIPFMTWNSAGIWGLIGKTESFVLDILIRYKITSWNQRRNIEENGIDIYDKRASISQNGITIRRDSQKTSIDIKFVPLAGKTIQNLIAEFKK